MKAESFSGVKKRGKRQVGHGCWVCGGCGSALNYFYN